MENIALPNVRVNLLVKPAEWELVRGLLQVLQRKDMVEFKVEDAPGKSPGQPEWTVKSLNEMLEKAEQEESIPYEKLREKYGL